MESSKKRLMLGVFVLVSTIVLISVFVVFRNKTISDDLSELSSIIDTHYVEYKSERGLGNDRFDIYSFELRESNETNLLKPKDRDFQDLYSYFESMVENIEGEERSDKTSVRTIIEKYISNEDTKYLSVDLEGTKKLYLYNEEMNKGYCLVLTI